MHPQSQSPLFRLPGEIREKIQREALKPDDALDLLSASTKYPERRYLDNPHAGTTPALMRTCKRMGAEMSAFAFSEATIHESRVDYGSRIGMNVHGPLRWERLRLVHVVVATSHSSLALAEWSTFLDAVLGRSPRVDKVVVHWHPLNPWGEVDRLEESARRRGADPDEDEDVRWTRRKLGKPDWIDYFVRREGLREVRFEGDVPRAWLDSLRQESRGRIRVSANFVPLEGGVWHGM